MLNINEHSKTNKTFSIRGITVFNDKCGKITHMMTANTTKKDSLICTNKNPMNIYSIDRE